METFPALSSFAHPFTYINPISGAHQELTDKQQNTIIALTIVLGIFTVGLATFPVLYGLSAFYRNKAIKQIQKSENETVSKADQQMRSHRQTLDVPELTPRTDAPVNNESTSTATVKSKTNETVSKADQQMRSHRQTLDVPELTPRTDALVNSESRSTATAQSKTSAEKIATLALVQKNGDNFEHQPEAMRNDEEVRMKNNKSHLISLEQEHFMKPILVAKDSNQFVNQLVAFHGGSDYDDDGKKIENVDLFSTLRFGLVTNRIVYGKNLLCPFYPEHSKMTDPVILTDWSLSRYRVNIRSVLPCEISEIQNQIDSHKLFIDGSDRIFNPRLFLNREKLNAVASENFNSSFNKVCLISLGNEDQNSIFSRLPKELAKAILALMK